MKSRQSAIIFSIFTLQYIYLNKVGMQLLFWFSLFCGIGFLWWIIDIIRFAVMSDEEFEEKYCTKKSRQEPVNIIIQNNLNNTDKPCNQGIATQANVN